MNQYYPDEWKILKRMYAGNKIGKYIYPYSPERTFDTIMKHRNYFQNKLDKYKAEKNVYAYTQARSFTAEVNRWDKMINIIFNIPREEVPLYLGEHHIRITTAVRWRCQIGK